MTTLTCEHCESEIDVAKDPRCVVYDPSGATSVVCKACRAELLSIAQRRPVMRQNTQAGVGDLNLPKATQRGYEALREAYRIKRGWRA
jgi:hypothetical protein